MITFPTSLAVRSPGTGRPFRMKNWGGVFNIKGLEYDRWADRNRLS